MIKLKEVTVILKNVTIQATMKVTDTTPDVVLSRFKDVMNRGIHAGEVECLYPSGSLEIDNFEVSQNDIEVLDSKARTRL